MATLLNELRAMGCDIDEALERFLDNEQFYVECLEKFLDDGVFPNLETSLSSSNVEESFQNAHNLKGVCANLGLTPMYTIIYDMVEDLRVGKMPENAMERFHQIQKLRDDIKQLL